MAVCYEYRRESEDGGRSGADAAAGDAGAGVAGRRLRPAGWGVEQTPQRGAFSANARRLRPGAGLRPFCRTAGISKE